MRKRWVSTFGHGKLTSSSGLLSFACPHGISMIPVENKNVESIANIIILSLWTQRLWLRWLTEATIGRWAQNIRGNKWIRFYQSCRIHTYVAARGMDIDINAHYIFSKCNIHHWLGITFSLTFRKQLLHKFRHLVWMGVKGWGMVYENSTLLGATLLFGKELTACVSYSLSGVGPW